MFMFKNVPMQDGSQRSRGQQMLLKEGQHGAGLEKLKKQYKNDVELEYHVDQLKLAVLTEAQWISSEGDVSKPSTREKYATSLTKHYAARRSDKKEYTFGYADLPRLNLNDIEDMYLLKVQDKLHHLYYQRTLNLTKPKLYFEGIGENIPYTMSGREKGVVYLNQHNHRSLIKLNEVHKFCDGTLMKIRDNLINMVNKNELGHGNKRLKGRDWNEKDIKRSNEMLDKIDQTMKHREQLRRFEEYVGGRPKTIDSRFYVRP
ncbi:hypothetical protein Tco_1245116 [Tanacetum coccineum]